MPCSLILSCLQTTQLIYFQFESPPLKSALSPGTRYTLRLSDYIPSGSGSYGTFAVFPSHTPLSASSLGSFISERGYVSINLWIFL